MREARTSCECEAAQASRPMLSGLMVLERHQMGDRLFQAPRGIANLHAESHGLEVARVEAAPPQILELRQ